MYRKKILIELTYYSPNLSGLTLYAKQLAEYMANNGFDITVLTSRFDKKLLASEIINKVKVKRCTGWRVKKGFVMPLIGWEALKLVRSTDVVNCHLPSVEAFWPALWAKVFGKKLIVTYHCYFESNNKLLDKTVEIIQNMICTWADHIVVNSMDFIDNYGLLQNFRNKILETYPPIDVLPADKEEEEHINKMIRGHNKVIGYLGRISQEKNIEILLAAIPYLEKELDNFVIALAGAQNAIGEEKYRQKIDSLIRKYQEHIVLIGEVRKPASFFAVCDCLILPSKSKLESFGMVSAEAISCNVPAIVSNTPGARVPVLKSGCGELFDPNDSSDLAIKIAHVLKQKQCHVEPGVFDKNKTFQIYTRLFEQI